MIRIRCLAGVPSVFFRCAQRNRRSIGATSRPTRNVLPMGHVSRKPLMGGEECVY